MKVLTRRKKMNSGELFQEYTKLVSKPVVDRAYRKYMKKDAEIRNCEIGRNW